MIRVKWVRVSQLVFSYQEDRYIVPSLQPLAFFSNELKTPIAAKEYNYTITSLLHASAAVVYTSVIGLGSCLLPVGGSGGSTNHDLLANTVNRGTGKIIWWSSVGCDLMTTESFCWTASGSSLALQLQCDNSNVLTAVRLWPIPQSNYISKDFSTYLKVNFILSSVKFYQKYKYITTILQSVALFLPSFFTVKLL